MFQEAKNYFCALFWDDYSAASLEMTTFAPSLEMTFAPSLEMTFAPSLEMTTLQPPQLPQHPRSRQQQPQQRQQP